MRSLLGIIRPMTTGHTENDAMCFQKANDKFPSSFAGARHADYNCLSISGSFQQYEDAGTRLLLYGEVYNTSEIAALLSVPPTENTAALIHTLVTTKGIDAIKNVNGQFIIFFYDSVQNKVSIVNDHMGVQQLLYHFCDGLLLFGSEVKFLLTHPECPGGIDWESGLKRPQPHTVLGSYKSYNTWFNGIQLMPEGSILEIDLKTGNMSARPYWRPQDTKPSPADARTAAEVMEEYIALLEDAIKIRMTGDGMTHSLMSGGLDSSAICGLAAKNGPLETFSIINQTTVLEGTTSFCHTMAEELNFKNAQFLVPYHELCFNAALWKQRVWRAESPVNHTDSLTKTMLHYGIRKYAPEVTSLLTGTGSDQLNGGLVHYIVPDAGTGADNWDNFRDAIVDTEYKLQINRDEEQLWQMRKLVNTDYLSQVSGIATEQNAWQVYIDGATHSEAFSLLWDEQRASASHGHITRYPFLDYRIVEFTAAIPPHLHKHLFYDKQILRVPSRAFLPQYIVDKPKKPYELPEYDFRAELFNHLTQDNEQSLFTAAFGDINVPHPVINKKQLYTRILAMREKPEIMELQNIMHIINLALLEQLADKDERALDYESTLETPMHVKFDDPETALSFLRKRLGALTTDELIDRPLKFGENCSLLLDTQSNKYYLSKRNNLTYELDDDNADWKKFLMNIDNKSTTRQILEKAGIVYSDVEEFFMISLKEQILVINDKQIGY